MRGIDGQDLADHHPVEEHAQRGQPLLHRGFGILRELHLDKRRHMHPLHLGEIDDPVLGAETGELPHRLAVGAPGIGIADVRAEEVALRVLASGRAVKVEGREVPPPARSCVLSGIIVIADQACGPRRWEAGR